MQITVGQEEFNNAMACWLNTQGFNTDMYVVSVNVIAGRKFGTSAEIHLTPKGSTKIPSENCETESKSQDDISDAEPTPFKLGGD